MFASARPFISAPALFLLSSAWLGCSLPAEPGTHGADFRNPGQPGIRFPGPGKTDPGDSGVKVHVSVDVDPSLGSPVEPSQNTGFACDRTLHVDADSPALLVTDPAVLQGLSFRQVLGNLDWNTDHQLGIVQRLFDTFNSSAEAESDTQFNCDSSANAAFQHAPATLCPRPEGALAASEGFFTEGDPDFFYPVAAVNRFDLAPVDHSTCGEYRVIFAKESGKTDLNDRVFLIFEAVLPSPKPFDPAACYPVARFWKDLELVQDPAQRGARLASFYLNGLPGFEPVLSRKNLGEASAVGGGYSSTQGRARISVHAGAYWELRELHVVGNDAGSADFVPTVVGNNPVPRLFDALAPGESDQGFTSELLDGQLSQLAGKGVMDMGMSVSTSFLAGESALGGPALNDYAARGANNPGLLAAMQYRIDGYGLSSDCPANDPLTPESLLRRATMASCAGCHAPTQFLGPDRKVGCGVTWPDSLGDVHIDEHGQRSPALKDVFLPHRAEVLTTYLQACGDVPFPGDSRPPRRGQRGGGSAVVMPRTLGGSVTH